MKGRESRGKARASLERAGELQGKTAGHFCFVCEETGAQKAKKGTSGPWEVVGPKLNLGSVPPQSVLLGHSVLPLMYFFKSAHLLMFLS